MNNPDKWLVVRCKDDQGTFYKVFASWSGGYLTSDEWRLNSGITRIEQDGRYIIFYGISGSAYRCHYDMQGIAGASNHYVFKSLLDKFAGKMEVIRDFDYLTFIADK